MNLTMPLDTAVDGFGDRVVIGSVRGDSAGVAGELSPRRRTADGTALQPSPRTRNRRTGRIRNAAGHRHHDTRYRRVPGCDHGRAAVRRIPEQRSRRRHRRARRHDLHERHHIGPERRPATAREPDLLRFRDGRIRLGGRGRRRPGECAAVSHRRCCERDLQPLRRQADPDSRTVHPGPMAATRPVRRGDQCAGGSDDAGPNRQQRRGQVGAHPPQYGIRWRPHARDRDRTRTRDVAGSGVRERLRPHRDELDHRDTGPRRPSRRPVQSGPGRARPPDLGRPDPARHRPGDQGRRRQRGRHRGAGPHLRPRRPGLRGIRRHRPGGDDRGFFDTRDKGHVDDDGFLYIGGRVDDTIIRGGENIAPAEIEAVLLRHPTVLDVAVVGVADEEWGQRIEAAVVVRPGTPVDGDGLRQYVRDALRGSKTPDRIVYWDEIPRTETGKLNRRHVAAQLTAETSQTSIT